MASANDCHQRRRLDAVWLLLIALVWVGTAKAQVSRQQEFASQLRQGNNNNNVPVAAAALDDSNREQYSSSQNKEDVPQGLSFSRTIHQLPSDASYYLHLDGNHCQTQDQYGVNDCHYEWGDIVRGNYTFSLPTAIDVGDTMHGVFTIDRFVPYAFSCPLCGDPCVLQVPVLEVNYTIATPPCPVGPTFSHFVKEPLRSDSPTDGIRTHLQGTVRMRRANGAPLAKFSVSVYVK